MKRLICLSLMIFGIVAAQAAQNVNVMIENYVKNRGGAAALNAISSLRVTGRFIHGDGVEIKYSITLARPDKVRSEFTVYDQTSVSGHSGGKAWQQTGEPGAVPIPLTGLALEGLLDNLELLIDPLLSPPKKYGPFRPGETETINNQKLLSITADTGAGASVSFYIGDADYSLVKIIRTGKKANGKVTRTEARLGDYRTYQGVRFACRRDIFIDGLEGGSMLIDAVDINVNPPDALFNPPNPL